MIIPFNIPYTTGQELEYIREALASGHLSGNGPFTKRCHKLLEEGWGINKALLTSSCTDALEMSAILLNIKPGDEVILPSYTFVSTALAFTRQGAVVVFVDSRRGNPGIDEEKIEELITERTKAIIPVHYNGIACEMDRIMEIAGKYRLWVVEDAAHAFGARYKGRLLGTIGHLGCFSFHETKIIHCGEGGMLSVNDDGFTKRAEIIWEKGTNRCDFHRGKISKYEWIDTGSSFLMSDISAAFLYSQLLESDKIIANRKIQWELYFRTLKGIAIAGFIKLPIIPFGANINYSIFYLTTRTIKERELLLSFLKEAGIQSITHYLDLSQSPYMHKYQPEMAAGHENKNTRKFENTLIRLPLYHQLTSKQILMICNTIKDFYTKQKN